MKLRWPWQTFVGILIGVAWLVTLPGAMDGDYEGAWWRWALAGCSFAMTGWGSVLIERRKRLGS